MGIKGFFILQIAGISCIIAGFSTVFTDLVVRGSLGSLGITLALAEQLQRKMVVGAADIEINSNRSGNTVDDAAWPGIVAGLPFPLHTDERERERRLVWMAEGQDGIGQYVDRVDSVAGRQECCFQIHRLPMRMMRFKKV